MKALGQLRHLITLENPGAAIPDGDGGYTQTWVALDPPEMLAWIDVAGRQNLERWTSATILAQATHVVNLRYHPGVTTKTRIGWIDRAGTTHRANVTDVNDVEERGRELLLAVAEIVA